MKTYCCAKIQSLINKYTVVQHFLWDAVLCCLLQCEIKSFYPACCPAHFWKSAVQTLLNWIFEIELRARSRPAYRGSGPLLLLRFNVRRSPDSFSKSSPESKLEVLQNVKLKNWGQRDICSCLLHSLNLFPGPVMKTHWSRCRIVGLSTLLMWAWGASGSSRTSCQPTAALAVTHGEKNRHFKNPRLCFDVLESCEKHWSCTRKIRTPWAPRLGRTIVSI